MRFFRLLIATTALASYSYAEAPDLFPESCSEFLQMVYGKEDLPSKDYSLTIEKGKDISKEGKKAPTFHLRADGIPKGKKFQIANRNAMGQVTVVFEGVHLGNGTIASKDKGVDTCETILCGGFGRGEPSQFLLIDPEKETTNAVFYLPYPVEPALMDELKVTMHYVSSNPEAYLFDIENLTPGEKVLLRTAVDSQKQKMRTTFYASDSGKAACLNAWVSEEPPSGEGSLEVKRDSGTLVIKFPWDRESSNLPSPLVIFTIGHSPTAKEIEFARKTYMLPSSPPPREI